MAEFATIKPLPVGDFTLRMIAVCEDMAISPVKLHVSTPLMHHNWDFEGQYHTLHESESLSDIQSVSQEIPSLLCLDANIKVHDQNRRYNDVLSFRVDRETGLGKFELKHVGDKTTANLIARSVAKHFDTFTPEELVQVSVSEASGAVLEARKAQVATLDTQAKKLASFLEDLAKSQSEHAQRVDLELREKYTELERQLSEEYSKKTTSLTEREEKLKQQLQDFDTRQAKYVRRDHLKQIQDVLEQTKSAELSSSTVSKRSAIHKLCISSLLFFGIMLLGVAAAIIYRGKIDPSIIPLLTIGSLGIAGTLVYYLKWNDAWFSQHAKSELANQKMGVDMLRASWLAELLFDWESDRKQDLPEDLRQIFASGLFLDPSIQITKHPADDLLEFAKKISAIRAGKDKLEIEADR
ncbi:MAG TPA: hypothetical protein EYO33_08660 [Phycisphaerales bacterium]|nr:hypothetical protein [Phycisphaerales bacterium]